jgi:hypothetical protein
MYLQKIYIAIYNTHRTTIIASLCFLSIGIANGLQTFRINGLNLIFIKISTLV